MKKFVRDMLVAGKAVLNDNHVLLTLTNVAGDVLPEMKPGQFVQVLVEDSGLFPLTVWIMKSKNCLS